MHIELFVLLEGWKIANRFLKNDIIYMYFVVFFKHIYHAGQIFLKLLMLVDLNEALLLCLLVLTMILRKCQSHNYTRQSKSLGRSYRSLSACSRRGQFY